MDKIEIFKYKCGQKIFLMGIRKATKRDLKEIVRLRREFYLKYCCSHDKFLNPEWAKRGLPISTALALKKGNLFIAEEDNKIVGYTVGEIKKQPPYIRYPKKGVIDNVFVKKEYRDRGIGKKLIKEIISCFRKKGVSWTYLLVYPDNKKAYNLYKKLGFKEWFIEMNLK